MSVSTSTEKKKKTKKKKEVNKKYETTEMRDEVQCVASFGDFASSFLEPSTVARNIMKWIVEFPSLRQPFCFDKQRRNEKIAPVEY